MNDSSAENEGTIVPGSPMFAYFMREDPPYRSVLLAIGHTVLAAATLEKVLSISIAHRQAEGDGLKVGLADDLLGLQKRTAGALLNELRRHGIPDLLADRIADVVKRRNDLVHHALEDPFILAALTRGEGVPEVVARILTIAEDCERLVAELGPSAVEGVESAFGATVPEMMRVVESFDTSEIPDDRRRARVEAFQVMRRINPSMESPADETPGSKSLSPED